MLHRRKFLTGLISALAAPAIVRAGNLMPIRMIIPSDPMEAYYKLLNDMMNSLAKQVAENIINGRDNAFPFDGVKGLVIRTVGNVTEGETSILYPYKPLEIKPLWMKDFYK